jgi:hypothetical protein
MACVELPRELPAPVPESPGATTYSDDLEAPDELVEMQVSAFNDRSVEQVRQEIFPRFGLT